MKKRKIAVPVKNNLLSMHFGQAEQFYFFEIEGGESMRVERMQSPEHADGVYPEWLKNHGVTDVISGGIGKKAIDRLHMHGINVFDGAPIKPPEELVKDLVAGKLEKYGNYCDH